MVLPSSAFVPTYVFVWLASQASKHHIKGDSMMLLSPIIVLMYVFVFVFVCRLSSLCITPLL